ncbi:hypothetical protein BV898_05647 [Hypsibius exemplaris]|uniref:Uncharacterized protein n=1 Tax=Hypsibius exemplaris TaxID=2072580 RepID=A0A1W0WYS5_HYPEX|nr:hypothetical protein BV898_05647 [Hypsibius exemplaris]
MTTRNRKIFVVSVMVLSAAIVNPRSSIKAELFNRTHSRSIPEELLERAYAYGQEKAVAEMTKTEIVTSATLSVFNRTNEQKSDD